ncbi:MAG: hypothetical protein JRC89_11305, partial [Deltaproteobacteria bacterium]|nr:hypothetical protein [Deltaproteobacteria bacterium]
MAPGTIWTVEFSSYIGGPVYSSWRILAVRTLKGDLKMSEKSKILKTKNEIVRSSLLEKTQRICMASNKKKMDITDLLPFNLLGNKAELLADSIGGLLKRGAKSSDRIIDAFAGTGAYIHYLKDSGNDNPMILNEFEPFRFVTHKQIKDNPLSVSFGVKYY